jgi:hypothetical protein
MDGIARNQGHREPLRIPGELDAMLFFHRFPQPDDALRFVAS